MHAAAVVIFMIVAAVQYVQVRNIEKSMDGSEADDERAGRIEEIVSWPILTTNVLMAVNFFFIAASAEMAFFSELAQEQEVFYFVLPMVLFFVNLIFVIVIQKLSLDVEKRMNPEKTVSIFDIGFNRKWLEESDEAEKLKSYKAGYAGFRAMIITCMILWVIAFMAQLVFKTGVFPVLVICIVWAVGMIASSVTAIRLEK